MDKLSAHQKGHKQTKTQKKKKQIKVVYISNPMKFKATASEFKGLVQQFTGQDSDVADLYRSTGVDHYDDPSAAADDEDSTAPSRPDASATQQQQQQPYRCAGPPFDAFDAFDDVFTPQVLENLAAFMPSSLYYEPPPPVSTHPEARHRMMS